MAQPIDTRRPPPLASPVARPWWPAAGSAAVQHREVLMKLARLIPAVLLVPCLLTSAASAARLGVGKSVVWLGLNGNQTQLVGPTTGLLDPTGQIATGRRFE